MERRYECDQSWSIRGRLQASRRSTAGGHRRRPKSITDPRISVDGTEIPYGDQIMWSSNATLAGLPSTAMPIALSDEGLPIGMQIMAPIWGIAPRLHSPMNSERPLAIF
jgi:amidase